MKKKHIIMVIGITALSVTLFAGIVYANQGGPTVWPKNDKGVTYGSGADAVSPEDEPDLIRVIATNGKEGYAYRTDLEEPAPSSPAAAIAQQEARNGKPVTKVIPVYEKDGVTKIGAFSIEGGGEAKPFK